MTTLEIDVGDTDKLTDSELQAKFDELQIKLGELLEKREGTQTEIDALLIRKYEMTIEMLEIAVQQVETVNKLIIPTEKSEIREKIYKVIEDAEKASSSK